MSKKRKIDWLLITAYLLLSIIGLLMIYSASSYRLMTAGGAPAALFQRQLIFSAVELGNDSFDSKNPRRNFVKQKVSCGTIGLWHCHVTVGLPAIFRGIS